MLKRIFLFSRPRFWMYCLGSFLIGLGAVGSLTDIVTNDPMIAFWLLYFTLPANLFVYGVNDLADSDTDVNNPKKEGYEIKFKDQDKKYLIVSILFLNIIFLPFIFSRPNQEIFLWVLFILGNIFYSLKPFRLKAVPFVDSISNGFICAFMGILGYISAGGNNLSYIAVVAGFLWSAAMHAFSAIPDIESDKNAGLKTVATVLGKNKTLYFVLYIYLTIGILFYLKLNLLYILLVIPYLILIIVSIYKNNRNQEIFSVYKTFPFVTYLCGYLVYLLNVIL